MSSFILLCRNVNLCQSLTLPLPPFARLYHLSLTFPLSTLCICFLAFNPIHSSTPTNIPLPSVCIPLALSLCFLQLTASCSPPSIYPTSCIDIAHFSTASSCLLFCFTPLYSLSLSAWGSSSDIITPTVTMVSRGRYCNNWINKQAVVSHKINK